MEMEMEMEMEMRAEEEIEVGQDLTPSLPPLCFALHDSLLSSHCSSCFSPLPPQPFPPLHTPPFPNNSHHVHYCSPLCSASDSPLHLSSAEPSLLRLLHSHPSTYPHGDSSDLRAALRLLHSLPPTSPPAPTRISGLLTNRLRLIDHDDDLRIRDGARAMFLARTMRDAQDDDAVLEEAVLCLVLTNAVEVQDNTGRTLGIAVYDSCFSWINHSCSPNACYRFLLSSPSPPQCAETPLRIVPAGQIESGVCSKNLLTKECGKCGPRVIVRSIKRINRGEEVTITYTDLLQPKAMRQSELWSRYRFVCSCKRCSASPLTYIDHALEDIYAVNFNCSRLSSDISFNRDKATERLTDYIDDAIADYLSIGNPESSYQRLEQVLTQGLSDNQQEGNEEKSELTYWLSPLHHLSLNAYTTLASAYKIHADDLLTLSSSMESIGNHVMKAFGMSRTSAAYSLLLAGAAHHLFNSESSLVVNVAHFWTITGDSLLNLAKSSLWSEINRWDLPVSDHLELYLIAKYKCPKCSLMDKFKTYSFHNPVKHADFEHASREFLDCVTNLTQKVWYFLVQGCRYLGLCKNPIDFCWLDTSKYSSECEVLTQSTGTNCGNKRSFSGSEAEEDTNQLRMYILYLGVHCLLYGEFLASICYGRYSHLTCYVHNILDREEKSSNPCH